jgi:hypothetical protein
MMKQTIRQYRFVMALALVLTLSVVGTVSAESAQSTSTNYSVSEVQIGGDGSALKDCSTNYCAHEAVGDTVDGSGSSANYQARFGSDPTDLPLLQETVTGGTQSLGTLQVSSTGTATWGVKVRDYLSSGYSLLVTGTTPSSGAHHLNALYTSCPCTSQVGFEQFGINLATNTTPAIGTAPVEFPTSAFSFGTSNSNYNQVNKFYYNNGDSVAGSAKQTGETDYTLSMIINISNVTPGGQYTGNFSAVVVPTY